MIDQRIQIAIISFLAGVILAFILFPRPEVETVYKFTTKVESDTIYSHVVDTIYVPKTRIKTQVLRDTVLKEYQPKISLFKTSFPSEYGSTHVSGEVLGEVLKMTATNDFKIPVVTNTITNTQAQTTDLNQLDQGQQGPTMTSQVVVLESDITNTQNKVQLQEAKSSF